MVWKAETGDPYVILAGLMRARGVDPMPPVLRQKGGKPYFPTHPHLHFSVSRSGGLSLCAVGENPLGADVERLRPRSPGLPRYALSGGEFAWFSGRGSRWEDFYTLWTLKEARVKCTGEGLFPSTAREIAVPLAEPGEVREEGGFRFTVLSGEGWRGAVCEILS